MMKQLDAGQRSARPHASLLPRWLLLAHALLGLYNRYLPLNVFPIAPVQRSLLPPFIPLRPTNALERHPKVAALRTGTCVLYSIDRIRHQCLLSALSWYGYSE